MEKIKPILYGVADYAEIRRAQAWFLDRTAKIRDLEATRYAMFLRPRRFGKSLFLSILEGYYDIARAGRFEELFAGTDIGANPTEERGKYMILYFNFSAVNKDVHKVEDSFEKYAAERFGAFAEKYADRMPRGLSNKILSLPTAGERMNALFSGLQGVEPGIYCLIDEYDNFTNTILAESGLNAYNELCHGDGFFKQFFTELKALTTSLDAPLKRLFITGVSPVTMDDVTSGFNIGTNISLMPQYADLTGFRHADLRAISDYYGERCGFDPDRLFETARTWYDNYRFGSVDAPPVANTTIVLSFFNYIWQTRRFPKELIDENLRTDYAKIRHLVTANRRLNGNFHVLENLLAEGALTERIVKSFQANELTKKENFTSLLYWLGITTITGESFGKTVFGVANETLKELAAKMIPAAYSDVHKIDERVYDINSGLCDFAEKGEWRGFVDMLASIVKENFAVRDSVEGEKVVQSTLVALLTAAGGPYLVRHEREAGGGFYDIALKPQLDRWPEIAHAALVEMKYVKAGDPAPSPDQLADIKAKAVEQLDKYSSDPALTHGAMGASRPTASTSQPFNLSTSQPSSSGGRVRLHRLVLVFHGGDCVLAEEV